MVEHIRIPKRIGAVKVPKKIRKRAKKAIKAAASPFVRDFAGAAMAAAQRVRREAEELRERRGSKEEAEEFRDRASEWKEFEMCDSEHIHLKGSKVAEAFRDAAIAGIRTLPRRARRGPAQGQGRSRGGGRRSAARSRAPSRPRRRSGSR